ncbi:endonuclease/exonuclease/phosphatase family protein [Pinibacter aurantiacus]|uniref:Endonuclease/exonuclease/phosphatase family protein n=1 Tax=Pinibacter aurantiacus TaxID=2851599 RepID=A0A9E2W2D2_9BACT|nr:endonuclease/exonuclease/phosphatase family protein [Pinibacter aurantiacus]MBV4355669.1 endonuclease/exonuclease/phosphatase family protein [Pinibacter aurantiacus]
MNKRTFGLFALLLIVLMNSVYSQKFKVGTYNIRYANGGDSSHANGWGQRLPVITGLIRFHDFDIFGTQEGFYKQLEEMKAGLPGYTYIGVGRDDGKEKGEHSAIFYKTDKFELLDHGDFWLSTITDKPNKGWDAALPRICSWGKFKEKKTGFIFFMYNLHMDHIGVEARRESCKLILKKIQDMKTKIPVILTGDFNVDQTNESYTLLNTSGLLRDAYETTEIRYATNGTFNDFKTDTKTSSRIDHIFLTKNFKVLRYGILTDTYRAEIPVSTDSIQTKNFPKEVSLYHYEARVPSDHFPVLIELGY